MTPRTRSALFAVPLVAFVVVLGLGLPALTSAPMLGAVVLVPTGSFALDHAGSWFYGVVFSANGTYPVRLADHWTEFHRYVNDSAAWRVTGAWNATEPAMVILSWGSLWTTNATLGILQRGCSGAPPSFCLLSYLLPSEEGRVDVRLDRVNDLCWDPFGPQGPCVSLGSGTYLGVGMDRGERTFVGNGTVTVSVAFVAPWYPDSVTVQEPFTLEPVTSG